MTPRRILTAAACAVVLFVVAGCTGGATNSTARHTAANLLIDPNGSIGGIVPGETRANVEARLGDGTTLSRRMHSSSSGAFLEERVRYPGSALTIMYVRPNGKPEAVFAVFTASPRYHTKDGLHVGSPLEDARHTDGIRCSPQLGTRFTCQAGLGFEKPVSAFDVRDGRVARFVLVAVAD